MLALQLRSSATDGDVPKLERLLKGFNALDKDEESYTPLHYAAWGGATRLLEDLLKDLPLLMKRSNLSSEQIVNAKNESGQSALHLATAYGKLEATRILLSNGAIVNIKDKVGLTPLHVAAEGQWGVVGWEGTGGKDSKHHDVIRMLLANGADPTALDTFGRSPLDVAANNAGIRSTLQRAQLEAMRVKEKDYTGPDDNVVGVQDTAISPATSAGLATGAVLWDAEGVASWLGQLGLGEYAPVFRSKAINGKLLLRLTPEKIAKLIPDEFHRERLLDELEDLKTAGNSNPAPPGSTSPSMGPQTIVMRSMPGSTRSRINVDNNSPIDIRIHQFDTEGRHHLKRILSPSEAFSEDAQEGTLYQVTRDKDGTVIAYGRVARQPTWLSITSALADEPPTYEQSYQ